MPTARKTIPVPPPGGDLLSAFAYCRRVFNAVQAVPCPRLLAASFGPGAADDLGGTGAGQAEESPRDER